MRSSRTIRKMSRRKIAAARALAADFQQNQLNLAGGPRLPTLADLADLDLSPVPLAFLSRNGVVISAASSLFRLFNAERGDILNKPIANLLQPSELPAAYKFLSACAQSGETSRARFSMALPGRAAREILLVISPAEPILKVAAFRAAFVEVGECETRDVGFRSHLEDSRLISSLDAIVWEADYPRRFTFVSSQVQRILGFSPDHWLQDPYFWQSHIHHGDRDRIVQARAEAARTLAPHVLEYRMVTADRKTVWVKDSAVVLPGPSQFSRMCGIMTDISDLESARADLKRANETLEVAIAERTAKMQQSLEAMETLCYGIAHDLKAPLRGLQGFIGILMTDYEKVFDKEAKAYAQRCQLAVARMGELIEAVLAYGRLNHTLPELLPIRPKPFLDRVIQTLEPEITATGARLEVQMTFPGLIGNPFLLEQIFTNLIGNALKFTKPGARPEISISATEIEPFTESTQSPDPQSRDREGASHASFPPAPLTTSDTEHSSTHPPIHTSASPVVRITVTDHGIGIPPNAAARMFGMFQKLHRPQEYAGTGIGLAVVKRAVELMNGRVGVFSEPDHGSSFWIELPSAS